MSYQPHYAAGEPLRADVDRIPGRVVLEFGAPWCGHCQLAQPLLQILLAQHPGVAHLKIEDGRGQPLGRSLGVKLWPTLVVMDRGRELARSVRPRTQADLREVAAALESSRGDHAPPQ